MQLKRDASTLIISTHKSGNDGKSYKDINLNLIIKWTLKNAWAFQGPHALQLCRHQKFWIWHKLAKKHHLEWRLQLHPQIHGFFPKIKHVSQQSELWYSASPSWRWLWAISTLPESLLPLECNKDTLVVWSSFCSGLGEGMHLKPNPSVWWLLTSHEWAF